MDGIDRTGSTADYALIRSTATSSVVRATTETQATAPSASATSAQAGVANLITLLAKAPPPIDSKKVEAIRALIASGRFPIDERAIAAKMISLDIRPAPNDN
ncbi:flagellar biosynthesis anti-sigma factor FlgM [Sphingomonas morindae]|uniref:Negative regulator of flagellin synthesis n=1 Tax=Sphingomonas morindae TaxID=1541170 RepID=A0ABY4X9L1_9SPHN|nr:flagellar biosynthesis anti-sigma factor FlgM [Sphingomonas morindae]USI73622.1 flagellar biosynthesis anti-sigma factor FlgM [Sphingomonas morindae]